MPIRMNVRNGSKFAGDLRRFAVSVLAGLIPLVAFVLYAKTFDPLRDYRWTARLITGCVLGLALVRLAFRNCKRPAFGAFLSCLVVVSAIVATSYEAQQPFVRREEVRVVARWGMANRDALEIREVGHPLGPSYYQQRLVLVRGRGIWQRSKAIAAPTADFLGVTEDFVVALPDVGPSCVWTGTATTSDPMGGGDLFHLDTIEFSSGCGELKREW